VNGSLLIGYERATKHYFKHGVLLLREVTQLFLSTPIAGAVNKTVMPALDAVVGPLQAAIPSPISDILNVQKLATDSTPGRASLRCPAVRCPAVRRGRR
jgi:hypothetical protein